MPSTSMPALAAAIRRRLQAAADPKYRESIARLVPGVRTWGVRVPALRAEAAAVAKGDNGAAAVSFDEACALLDRFCTDGWRDEILLGTFLVARFKKQLPTLTWKQLGRWVEAVDNWETCDQIAMGLAAGRAAADMAEGLPELKRLARSPNPWRRRFAVATAAALNQRGRSFPAETLAVCDLVGEDPDANVRKAVAWALRSVKKRPPAHRKAPLG